jgi:hypothetical protein
VERRPEQVLRFGPPGADGALPGGERVDVVRFVSRSIDGGWASGGELLSLAPGVRAPGIVEERTSPERRASPGRLVGYGRAGTVEWGQTPEQTLAGIPPDRR